MIERRYFWHHYHSHTTNPRLLFSDNVHGRRRYFRNSVRNAQGARVDGPDGAAVHLHPPGTVMNLMANLPLIIPKRMSVHLPYSILPSACLPFSRARRTTRRWGRFTRTRATTTTRASPSRECSRPTTAFVEIFVRPKESGLPFWFTVELRSGEQSPYSIQEYETVTLPWTPLTVAVLRQFFTLNAENSPCPDPHRMAATA